MACEYCNYTDYVPTHFDGSGGSNFVDCPKCINNKEFNKVMGWTPKENKMKRVILESPFAGDTERNIEYARKCMRDCIINHNEAPIASHLLYTQPGILDDNNPVERDIGITCGLVWGIEAEATIVYEDYGVSKGMQYGIKRAKKEGRKVIYRKIL